MGKENKRYKYWIRKPIWKLYYEDESVIASDDAEATKIIVLEIAMSGSTRIV